MASPNDRRRTAENEGSNHANSAGRISRGEVVKSDDELNVQDSSASQEVRDTSRTMASSRRENQFIINGPGSELLHRLPVEHSNGYEEVEANAERRAPVPEEQSENVRIPSTSSGVNSGIIFEKRLKRSLSWPSRGRIGDNLRKWPSGVTEVKQKGSLFLLPEFRAHFAAESKYPVDYTSSLKLGRRPIPILKGSNSGRPPQLLVDLVDKAQTELPPNIHNKMRPFPSLRNSVRNIHNIETMVVPQCHRVTVMMAHNDGSPPQGQDPPSVFEDYSSGVTNSESDQEDIRSSNSRQSQTLSPRTPENQTLRPPPVNRRLVLNSPITPNPPPALSNDAEDALGNLTHLTQRLEIERERTDKAGVVPQSRFATPAGRPGSLTRQGNGLASGSPTAPAEGGAESPNSGLMDTQPQRSSFLQHPQPVRLAPLAPTILQTAPIITSQLQPQPLWPQLQAPRPILPQVQHIQSLLPAPPPPAASHTSQASSSQPPQRKPVPSENWHHIPGQGGDKKRRRAASDADAKDEELWDRYDIAWDRKWSDGRDECDRNGKGGVS
ncbi:hypothetical protein GQ44DRAFT_305342 [Phaeosphaeriaceae sp. PMI808]|nr:hypothetical protein GQ44DRAFT_305342 [Phaeosphaeriaceae sp. PMI808]